MAIIDLRGTGADLGQSFAGLGKGLADVLGITKREEEKKQFKAQVLANPRPTAVSLRAGADRKAFRDMGFSDKELDALIASNPETSEEKLDRTKLNTPDFAENTVTATNTQNLAAISAGTRAIEADKLADELGLDRKSAEHSLFKMSHEKIMAEGEQEQQRFQVDMMGRYAQYYRGLSPEEQRLAVTAFVNPGELSDRRSRESLQLQRENLGLQREQFNWQKKRAELEDELKIRGLTQEAMFKGFEMKESFREEFAEIEKRLQEGNLNPGEMQALAVRYNTAANDYASLFPDDPMTIMDTHERIMGKEINGISMRTVMPRDALVTTAAMAILSGKKKPEELWSSGASAEDISAVLMLVEDLKGRSGRSLFERVLTPRPTVGATFNAAAQGAAPATAGGF